LALAAIVGASSALTFIAGQSFAMDRPGSDPQVRIPWPADFPRSRPGELAGSGRVAPPDGSRPIGAFQVQAGTQNYTCADGAFAGAPTPEAILVGPLGTIHHFGGPSWELLGDGSTVTAVKSAEQAVSGAVPELLLKINQRSGSGLLAEATHIQRLATQGGVAPSEPCQDGQTASVPYSAFYVFWAAP